MGPKGSGRGEWVWFETGLHLDSIYLVRDYLSTTPAEDERPHRQIAGRDLPTTNIAHGNHDTGRKTAPLIPATMTLMAFKRDETTWITLHWAGPG